VLEIELLPAAAADDAGLVAEPSDLVNRAYAAAEHGLWRDGIDRTTPAETAAAVRDGELVVADAASCSSRCGHPPGRRAVPHGAGGGRGDAQDLA
jgi:hypothetical protein